ncbi:YpjP family protein [Virgibacillus soli]|uniref:YpjP family protein n=1 Tax=Paracerasibacillus soli TaxID=480284 RepID=A0ABU5CUX8_9BACI|nr:YpjP family protein [Virgibacillus soli]MDY0409646.1 YpjP family protein [Virgibacillus soli]
MKLWMRKIAVTLIAIVTLGMYVPPFHVTDEADNKDAYASKSNVDETVSAISTVEIEEIKHLDESHHFVKDDYIQDLTEKAKEQAVTKLGPKIAEQVEDEFAANILPAMESVLTTVLEQAADDDVPFYAITEQPAPGIGERIFHVYDERNQKDIARFHVRRDNRPLEGYWFNFHYHLSHDNFEQHHEIGEIYWDKNMPPKWMA